MAQLSLEKEPQQLQRQLELHSATKETFNFKKRTFPILPGNIFKRLMKSKAFSLGTEFMQVELWRASNSSVTAPFCRWIQSSRCQMGLHKVSREHQWSTTANVPVCSLSPGSSGLKLLWCVDWLQPLSFLVISFITYSQFTLAPLISLPQQGDVGCRWLMKNRIGFGMRQTECRHQSQNALIFNNPHLHVYKW